MANPANTTRVRWNRAVSAIATEMGWTAEASDIWLNGVWSSMYGPDETFNEVVAHSRFKRWLEDNTVDAPTFPAAFQQNVV